MELVYPKYSLMENVVGVVSGFKLQKIHLDEGLGIKGDVLQGTIGNRIERINIKAAIIEEVVILLLSCIILYTLRVYIVFGCII